MPIPTGPADWCSPIATRSKSSAVPVQRDLRPDALGCIRSRSGAADGVTALFIHRWDNGLLIKAGSRTHVILAPPAENRLRRSPVISSGVSPARSEENRPRPRLPRLYEFTKPVTLVWGQSDRCFTLELGRRLAAAFPDSELVESPARARCAVAGQSRSRRRRGTEQITPLTVSSHTCVVTNTETAAPVRPPSAAELGRALRLIEPIRKLINPRSME